MADTFTPVLVFFFFNLTPDVLVVLQKLSQFNNIIKFVHINKFDNKG